MYRHVVLNVLNIQNTDLDYYDLNYAGIMKFVSETNYICVDAPLISWAIIQDHVV